MEWEIKKPKNRLQNTLLSLILCLQIFFSVILIFAILSPTVSDIKEIISVSKPVVKMAMPKIRDSIIPTVEVTVIPAINQLLPDMKIIIPDIAENMDKVKFILYEFPVLIEKMIIMSRNVDKILALLGNHT